MKATKLVCSSRRSYAHFQWIRTDEFCLRQRSTGTGTRKSLKKISKVAVIMVMSAASTMMNAMTAAVRIPSLRTRQSSMMTDMVTINTTRRQLLYAMMTVDTVEMNTEMNTETIILSTIPLDGLGIR